MSRSKATKVYILGAGCSARYGIPLAKNFVNELQNYSNELQNCSAPLVSDSPLIGLCAKDTAQQMAGGGAEIETVDELVAQVENGLRSMPSSWSPNNALGSDSINRKKEIGADRQISDAKWATAALFLSREEAALGTGLRGYHDLLHEIFPLGKPLKDQLGSPTCHVLSFNYDRLFEITFLKHFGLDPCQPDPYGPDLMNTRLAQRAITFDENHFSFLKLHGSVGMWLARENAVEYSWNNPLLLDFKNKVNDKMFFDDGKPGGNLQSKWKPLLAFPHEKSFMKDIDYPFNEYLNTTWKRAQELIAQATQVWVIGYSFSAIDRDYNVRHLFKHAKRSAQFIIQNPDAERLCTMLQHKHPEFKGRLFAYTAKF